MFKKKGIKMMDLSELHKPEGWMVMEFKDEKDFLDYIYPPHHKFKEKMLIRHYDRDNECSHLYSFDFMAHVVLRCKEAE